MCMSFPILDISCKWNHTVVFLLCLIHFTYCNVFEAHQCCSFNSILKVNFDFTMMIYIDLLENIVIKTCNVFSNIILNKLIV